MQCVSLWRAMVLPLYGRGVAVGLPWHYYAKAAVAMPWKISRKKHDAMGFHRGAMW